MCMRLSAVYFRVAGWRYDIPTLQYQPNTSHASVRSVHDPSSQNVDGMQSNCAELKQEGVHARTCTRAWARAWTRTQTRARAWTRAGVAHQRAGHEHIDVNVLESDSGHGSVDWHNRVNCTLVAQHCDPAPFFDGQAEES